MTDLYSLQAAELLLKALSQDQTPFVGVHSDSMAPMFGRGDHIQLGPIDAGSPTIGDVIVLGSPGNLLAHRFWGFTNADGRAHLLTRGDRLPYYDPLTPGSQLRAVIIARRRSGRVLPFDHGPGAWLNRRLTTLAQMDAKVMHLRQPSDDLKSGPVGQYGLAGRPIRRTLFILAASLTLVVDRLPK